MKEKATPTRILVAIDLTPRGRPAIEAARRHAEAFGSDVLVLHVIQRIENIPQAELTGFYRQLEYTARGRVEAAVRQLVARGIRAQGQVTVGDVPREIARQAARSRADLVVLGSHRVDLRGRGRGFGTTSYKAAILCDCPVLLLK